MKGSKATILLIVLAISLLLLMNSGCKENVFELPERYLLAHKPATCFEESFPMGNGRLGATVYGGVTTEHIVLNEETLWAGGPVNPAMNPEAYKNLPVVRDALFSGDYQLADQLVRKIQGSFSQSYAPLGDLFIDMDHAEDYSGFIRKLNLRDALTTVDYSIKNVKYSREVFVSHPDQLLIIRLKASEPGALGFTLRQESKLKHSVKIEDDSVIMTGYTPVHAEPNYRGDIQDAIIYDDVNSMRFASVARIICSDGDIKSFDNKLILSNASEAVILVSMATSFNGFDKNPGTEGKDELVMAHGYLNRAEQKSFTELQDAHTRDFSTFFNRVSLNLSSGETPPLSTEERLKRYSQGEIDTDLEALYFQYGRYLLISSSRPGGIPANLQGIWNPHLRPPWSSNFTTNINLEMNYWLAETCNLSEMHEPLLKFIGQLKTTGEVTAKTFFNSSGWCANHNSDIWAMTNPVGDFGKGHPCWANWNMAGVWLSTHLWEHYQFTQDESFLKEYSYPLMKGAALFCLDWLIEDSRGYLVTAPSTSPENIYLTPEGYKGATTIATTADMAMIRELMQQCLAAAEIAGEEDIFKSKLTSALEKLYPCKIGKKGNLQEWHLDWEDADPEHRHVSHLFGLFPGSHISLEKTPELAEAVRKSLELRGDGGTGWSKAWKINLWARLHDGNRAYKLLRSHLNYTSPDPEIVYSGGGTYPNLWDAHPPFQIDGNFGGTSGISEMLLQSGGDGSITLLPALPDAWESGYIKGLRARGGFQVDISWKGGELIEAVIRSIAGTNCVVKYRGKSVSLGLGEGQFVKLNSSLRR